MRFNESRAGPQRSTPFGRAARSKGDTGNEKLWIKQDDVDHERPRQRLALAALYVGDRVAIVFVALYAGRRDGHYQVEADDHPQRESWKKVHHFWPPLRM